MGSLAGILVRVAVGLSLCVGGAVRAAEVSACDAALIKSTYNRIESSHLDWRLASMVDRKTYEEIKHTAGASAVIYGIPVGANYDDFRRRAARESSRYAESLTHDHAINIMWTGLDSKAGSAYSECLAAVVLTLRGLHLTVRSATVNDVAILVTWVPQGEGDRRTIDVTWSGLTRESSGELLPTRMTAGGRTVLVDRPLTQRNLAVNAPGFTGFVVLAPLPPSPERAVAVVWSTDRPGDDGAGKKVLCTDNSGPNRPFLPAVGCTIPGDLIHTGCWDNPDAMDAMCRCHYGEFFMVGRGYVGRTECPGSQ